MAGARWERGWAVGMPLMVWMAVVIRGWRAGWRRSYPCSPGRAGARNCLLEHAVGRLDGPARVPGVRCFAGHG